MPILRSPDPDFISISCGEYWEVLHLLWDGEVGRLLIGWGYGHRLSLWQRLRAVCFPRYRVQYELMLDHEAVAELWCWLSGLEPEEADDRLESQPEAPGGP